MLLCVRYVKINIQEERKKGDFTQKKALKWESDKIDAGYFFINKNNLLKLLE